MLQNSLHALLVAILGSWLTAGLPSGIAAQDRGDEPATLDQAAAALNLESFPLPEGARIQGPRRMASLTYQIRSDVTGAYEAVKQALASKGWREGPGSSLTAEFASGTFSRDGFLVSVSVLPAGPGQSGSVTVAIQQHGNVELARLPVPDGSKLAYSGPSVAMFVTETPRDEAARACRDLLIARGWEPYGTAGDSLIFKRNAIRLNAMIAKAPGQGGKTTIQYTAELLSANLPAPPDASRVHYADTTKDLEFDVKASPDQLLKFYREALGKAGWKPTTERTVKTGARESLIFLNPSREMLTLDFAPIEGVLRGRLRHRSAAEVAELDRLAREKTQRAKNAGRHESAPRPTVSVDLPDEVRDVNEGKDGIRFTVDAGRARAVVESLRRSLSLSGWKEDVAVIENLAGAVSLSRDSSGSLTINYTDTGVLPAEVSISAIGATIRRAKKVEK